MPGWPRKSPRQAEMVGTFQTEAAVPSPCIALCEMDAASGFCRGCLRTIDEIAGWAAADDAAKQAVWAAIARRRAGCHG